MCGRYVRKDSAEVVYSFFEINDLRIPWKPCFNVAPTTRIPVIRRQENGRRELVALTWNLRPAWAAGETRLPVLVNARAETIAAKPAFREAFRHRRCVVPASGYFEWQKRPDGSKQPFYFERADGRPIAFAAVWEGDSVATITTTPNRECATVHHRMPVILEPEDLASFLSASPGDAAQFLRPAPDGTLTHWPVSHRVGQVRYDGPDLIEPAPENAPLPDRPTRHRDDPTGQLPLL